MTSCRSAESPNAPRIGRRPAFEYAVKMRQFPDDALLDRRLAAGALPAAALLRICGAPRRVFTPASAARPNRPDARRTLASRGRQRRGARRAHCAAAFARAARRAQAWTSRKSGRSRRRPPYPRGRGRRTRECHGDLHLAEPAAHRTADRRVRRPGIRSEAARDRRHERDRFLAMDLLAHRRADLAYAFLTRYLETGGDYAGLEVLRFYLAYRAMIRAKVRAIKAAQHAAADRARNAPAQPYLELAAELVAPRRPLLLITHGLSGSGKTHVTERAPRPPARPARPLRPRAQAIGGRRRPARARIGDWDGGATTASRPSRLTTGSRRSRDWRSRNRIRRDRRCRRSCAAPSARSLPGARGERRDARFAILDCVAATRPSCAGASPRGRPLGATRRRRPRGARSPARDARSSGRGGTSRRAACRHDRAGRYHRARREARSPLGGPGGARRAPPPQGRSDGRCGSARLKGLAAPPDTLPIAPLLGAGMHRRTKKPASRRTLPSRRLRTFRKTCC